MRLLLMRTTQVLGFPCRRYNRYTRQCMDRMTKQRRAILGALEAAGRPLSPQELTDLAAADVASLNLATVYRNLKALCASGHVRTVELVGRPARYELAGLGHHHHFLCTTCDRVFDLPACGMHAAHDLAPEGFEVTHHEIQLSGRCRDCCAR